MRYIATTYRSRISRDSTSRPRRIPSSRPRLPIKRRFCRDSTAHNSISQANHGQIYNVADRFMSRPYGIAGALMLTGLVFTAWFLLYPAGGGSTLAPVTDILIDASGTRIGADTKLRINIQYDPSGAKIQRNRNKPALELLADSIEIANNLVNKLVNKCASKRVYIGMEQVIASAELLRKERRDTFLEGIVIWLGAAFVS